MGLKMRTKTILTIFVSVLLIGCFIYGASSDEDMYKLASALTKLSAAVESTVRYKDPPQNLSDDKLLEFATRHDPSLLQSFITYRLRVLHQDRHAIVLVCTKDGTHALLEDAGCTGELDAHLWQHEPRLACEFTLTVAQTCTLH